MNKAEFAMTLSEKLNVPKKTAEDIVDAFEHVITQTLMKGDEVTIAGFGTFSARTRSARMGVNPRNPQEKIQVPAVRVPKFKAGKGLKDALKGKNVE
jgi:DNA-binding protein HU-beta